MKRVLLFCLLPAAVLFAALAPRAARSVEPAREFLDALRKQGYFDVAVEYLDTIPDNPAVPVTFKQTLKYEKGVTLVQGAKFQRDTAIRDKWLDDGQKALTEFVNENKEHLLAMSARSNLGNVLVERARARMKKSEKLTGEAKTALYNEARAFYLEARTSFETHVNELRERLKAYPASITEKSDPKKYEEREQFRKDFLQAQLLVAATIEELAETYPAKSAEQTKAYTDAAEGYKNIHDLYRSRLAGLYARMYQARCLQKLGKHKEAIGYFTELMSNKDESDELHTLLVKVIDLAIDSWLAEKMYKEIADKAVPVIQAARANEEKSEEFMNMRLKVAKGLKAYAEELKKSKAPADQALMKKLLTTGRKFVSDAAKATGPWQNDARKMIADFTGGDSETAAAQKPDPKTFLDARNAGKDAIQKMQESDLIVKQVGQRLPTIQDANERAQMQQQIDQAKAVADEAKIDAGHYLRLALQFSSPETDVNDLNLVRYLVCFLAYSEGKYPEAIVLGEFIAQKYPDSQGARQCAKIAMAGYLKLYAENQTDDKSFETQQIIAICDYITKKWPDQPEAEEALNTLIPFMIREKKLKEAQDYLAKIPAESPHRGTAELKTGQAMWANYLEGLKQTLEWAKDPATAPEEAEVNKRKAELEELKTKAKEILIAGVERMKASGEVSNVVATAVLSLAQIYVDTNESAKAVALLEEPKIGTLTLVNAKHPATEKEGFAVESFKTALRAYISALAATKDQGMIKKAEGMMDSLKETMGSTAEGQSKLVAIYVSLARDLQTQMEIADAKTKSDLGAGFEVFLDKIGKQATELQILYWVAETYRGMGESFPKGSADATKYLKLALDAYQNILAKGKGKPEYLKPAMAVQIRLQIARTNRALNNFVGAADAFVEILKSNPTMLPVQIEAARTYQEWGAGVKVDKGKYYGYAIVGARPDTKNPDKTKQGKNVIWGWGEIAKMTAGNPKYLEQFHEARYNVALTRYSWALAEKDKTLQTDLLKRAKSDIAATVGLYQDLGGPKWESQYDNLMKKIQKSLGETPVTGIAGFKPKAAAPAGSKGTPTKGTPAKGPVSVVPKTTTTSAPPLPPAATKTAVAAPAGTKTPVAAKKK